MGKSFGAIEGTLLQRHREFKSREKDFKERIQQKAETLKKEFERHYHRQMDECFKEEAEEMQAEQEKMWEETLDAFPEAKEFKNENLVLDTKTGELKVKDKEGIKELIVALESVTHPEGVKH